MERKLKTLTTKFVTRCILVMMLALFSIGGMRAQCPTMPEPVSYTQVLPPTTKKVVEKAFVDGVEVIRELHAGTRPIDKIKY